MAAPHSEWHIPPLAAVTWAVAVALLISTQYLAQPFVWRNWSFTDVVAGWLDVARDRVLVAGSIALALVLVTRMPARSVGARACLIGVAVVVGALAGELALVALDVADERIDTWSIAGRVAQWSGLGLAIAGIYSVWARHQEASAATRALEMQRATAEAALVQTQLQSLRQQIDPHFLFNTLATIRSLGETDVACGSSLLRHLVDYLRSTMSSGCDRTTLGEEVDLVASYLAIVAVRMSGRLAFEIDVPMELRRHPCPPLTLATLVENAVKHGITPRPGGGAISVAAREAPGALEIVVADTGNGFSAASGGHGIGLSNVRGRLQALHGSGASLTIEANVPLGVRATIRIPFGEGAAA